MRHSAELEDRERFSALPDPLLAEEHRPGGVMHVLLTPVYALFSNQGLRLTHHLVIWLLIGFVINHVYSIWLMDIKDSVSESLSIDTLAFPMNDLLLTSTPTDLSYLNAIGALLRK